METTKELAGHVGVKGACLAMQVPRASFYRGLDPPLLKVIDGRHTHHRGLSAHERKQVLDVLHSERFVNVAPGEVCATLLDEGTYLCSVSTMYRILEENHAVRERRDQLRHPSYHKPELLATGPNQVWSWDITKLKGPFKWSYFNLYVIMDIFSRYVVGWMVAHRESASLASRLIQETCGRQGVQENQLTIHADRGSSMTSRTVAQLLADLGVTKTHSRPHVSDDNPYSEAQFKTMKYRPDFPERFGCIADSRSFCRDFFAWYNRDHRHSGIGWMTPEMVHHGKSHAAWKLRERVLLSAAQAHPERFVRKAPAPPALPTAAWINKPSEEW